MQMDYRSDSRLYKLVIPLPTDVDYDIRQEGGAIVVILFAPSGAQFAVSKQKPLDERAKNKEKQESKSGQIGGKDAVEKKDDGKKRAIEADKTDEMNVLREVLAKKETKKEEPKPKDEGAGGVKIAQKTESTEKKTPITDEIKPIETFKTAEKQTDETIINKKEASAGADGKTEGKIGKNAVEKTELPKIAATENKKTEEKTEKVEPIKEEVKVSAKTEEKKEPLDKASEKAASALNNDGVKQKEAENKEGNEKKVALSAADKSEPSLKNEKTEQKKEDVAKKETVLPELPKTKINLPDKNITEKSASKDGFEKVKETPQKTAKIEKPGNIEKTGTAIKTEKNVKTEPSKDDGKTEKEQKNVAAVMNYNFATPEDSTPLESFESYVKDGKTFIELRTRDPVRYKAAIAKDSAVRIKLYAAKIIKKIHIFPVNGPAGGAVMKIYPAYRASEYAVEFLISLNENSKVRFYRSDDGRKIVVEIEPND